jgi:hypothetical protein
MAIDLRSRPVLGTQYVLDEDTGIITIRFTDDLSNVLGEIIIENIKLRALAESLMVVSEERSPNTEDRALQSTHYYSQQNQAWTSFR